MPDEKDMDALDSLEEQNSVISGLVDKWKADTQTLVEGDKVQVRWERGSAVKLLLQHMAVREEAKGRVVAKLREDGNEDLADRLEGDGAARRTDISALDEVARGQQAMNLNSPEIDVAVERLVTVLQSELAGEGDLLAEITSLLGPSGERDLPSAGSVRRHSVTHPNAEPKWYDEVAPLKAARALYDHLRVAPGSGTTPGVDTLREHDPTANDDEGDTAGT